MNSILNTNNTETIPAGLFLAIKPNQYSAIKQVEKIGKNIANNHSQIAEMYLNTKLPFRSEDLAKELIPDLYSKFPQVSIKAVAYALRLLIPKKERDQATTIRKSNRLKERIDFTSEEWKNHCRQALEARNLTGFVVNMHNAIIERGQIPWTEDEKNYVMFCVKNQKFLRNKKPHWNKIALNLTK